MTNQPKDQNTALPDSLPEELAENVSKLLVYAARYNAIPAYSYDTDKVYAAAIDVTNQACATLPALLSHIRQQDEKIKTLEMQGKWFTVSEANKHLKSGDKVVAYGPDQQSCILIWSDEGFYTEERGLCNAIESSDLFQRINPPSPDAQKE